MLSRQLKSCARAELPALKSHSTKGRPIARAEPAHKRADSPTPVSERIYPTMFTPGVAEAAVAATYGDPGWAKSSTGRPFTSIRAMRIDRSLESAFRPIFAGLNVVAASSVT